MAASVMMTTSTGSALASLRVTPTVPNESVTVCPVSCWKACASSVTMARTAPALSTLISAASTCAPALSVRTATPSQRIARVLIPLIGHPPGADRTRHGLIAAMSHVRRRAFVVMLVLLAVFASVGSAQDPRLEAARRRAR